MAIPASASAQCGDPAGDLTGDGTTTVVDVQCNILVILWDLGGQTGDIPDCLDGELEIADVNCDDAVAVSDVQVVISFVLGALLPEVTDTNGNQCPDLCEPDLDSDNDGSLNGDDCDPDNGDVFPGAAETCNGVDDDCDTVIDNGAADLECTDNDACTAEECVDGACITGGGVDCDDGDACTTDTCDTELGCQFEILDCDDGDACTTTSCDPVEGCLSASVDCDDGDACTADTCDSAAGCQTAPVDCDDQSVCTIDSCDPAVGCVNSEIVCDDGNECTVDSCDAALGCLASPEACDDGNDCTAEACIDGVCVVDSTVDCDDGDACTTEDCVTDTLVCDGGAVSGSSCFKGNDEELTWVEAKAACEAQGGQLAVIDNLPDNNAAGIAATLACGTSEGAWIGLTDEVEEGTFVWVDGSALDYSNWASGEPNDNGSGEDYAVLRGDLAWNDTVDGTQPCFVCEFTDVGETGGGACEVGDACDDSDPCTLDSCNQGSDSSCCSEQGGAGCDNSACEDCICGSDPFCCNVQWDDICAEDANDANSSCADVCQCDVEPGTCSNEITDCDDGNLCTTDSCDPELGCIHETLDCDDSRACTEEACVESEIDCPGGVVFGSSCFQSPGDALTYDNAKTACEDLGGTLAVIESQEENDAVRNAVDVGCGTSAAWIGLNDQDVEGTYVWVDGTPFDFENWNTNEPNDSGNEDGVRILNSGLWNDDKVGNTACYVCETLPSTAGTTCEVAPLCEDDACGETVCFEGGSCCNSKSSTGCGGNQDCEDCVCGQDAFCCNSFWDGLCAEIAATGCALSCGCGVETGVCFDTSTTNCDDGDPCTTDSCDSELGCQSETTDCDDGDICTTDSCDPVTGCVNEATLDCEDGDVCTEDVCDPAIGCANAPLDCDDGNACTTDSCDTELGCVNAAVADGEPCDDSDACTEGDACDAGMCVSGSAADCEDGNTCTITSCDSALGCQIVVQLTCDDQDPCTDDVCDSASGCANTVTDCDDADVCTTEVCDPLLGCQYSTIDCDDGEVCTDDSCDPVAGCVNTPVVCDDGDACTDNSCELGTGCVTATTDCDDATVCTIDTCDSATGCAYEDIDCDDGEGCTDDSCDAVEGCMTTPVDCDDSNACTAEACVDGACTTLTTVDCDDGDACTTESCITDTLVCEGGAVSDTSCFKGNAEELTWPDAKAACEAQGGQLAVIDNLPDNNAAGIAVALACGSGQNAWIGLTDEVEEGTFVWVDGSALDYTNWGGSEPNNAGGNENYVHLRGDLQWNDQGDTTRPCYVCEFTDVTETGGGACDVTDTCDDDDACTLDSCSQGSDSNCCGSKSGAGCDNQACEDCICALDAFCCNVQWDGVCGDDANSLAACVDLCQCGLEPGSCSHEPVDCDDGSLCTTDSCDTELGCLNEPLDCDDSRDCTADTCVESAIDCPGGVVFGSSCFQAPGENQNYDNAKTACENLGGTLAVIESDDENAAVRQAADIGCGSSAAWIGLNDQDTEGTYVWVDGTAFDYENWNDGEPNNSGNEDGVRITNTGAWNDNSTGNGTCYVCETFPAVTGTTCEVGPLCAGDACIETKCFEGGNCCNSKSSTGCSANQDCEDCVCGGDAFCCNSFWDGLCADRAANQCALSCGCGVETGVCFDTGTIDCDDGDLCTIDSCDSESGCANDPVDCDDGDACTIDSCDAATGCVYTDVACDDGNDCTTDSCDAAAGCVFTPSGADCDDGNSCVVATCQQPVVSTATCDELGWNATTYGSSEICGESDADLGGCSGDLSYDEAVSFCEAAGARLCTATELANDEARGTGCQYDDDLLWSSTPCDGGHLRVVGASPNAADEPTVCSDDTTVGVARCCADVTPAAVIPQCIPAGPSECIADGGSCEQGGECIAGPCSSSADCDDGIDCTVDACAGGVCTNIPNPAECSVGQLCIPVAGGCTTL